eukprot:6196575-Pleurochrysis_carterae.AAC.2
MYSASGAHVRAMRFSSRRLHASPCRTCRPSTGAPARSASPSPVISSARVRARASGGEGLATRARSCAVHQNQPRRRNGSAMGSFRLEGDSLLTNWSLLRSRNVPLGIAGAPVENGGHASKICLKKHDRSRCGQVVGDVNAMICGVCKVELVRTAWDSGLMTPRNVETHPAGMSRVDSVRWCAHFTPQCCSRRTRRETMSSRVPTEFVRCMQPLALATSTAL